MIHCFIGNAILNPLYYVKIQHWHFFPWMFSSSKLLLREEPFLFVAWMPQPLMLAMLSGCHKRSLSCCFQEGQTEIHSQQPRGDTDHTLMIVYIFIERHWYSKFYVSLTIFCHSEEGPSSKQPVLFRVIKGGVRRWTNTFWFLIFL